ncbi:MAG: DNA mismatch repair endonuclease MutL [Anaerolineae bacterium]|jgi:DNA mismatch repair protein MutL|nr:DNA mismatch repair endonuclease MutL [Anaerolineae bacterium]MBT4309551.1 DNA mismatch repair endonuclease MutL [Anaerolineae bacterium]MBT4458846.1 DNA mismatch repair endonuclease MutL [Anaerolineae bacterium]MBT4842636.1 DNA mismatch repair endonuclease MutL [Anaerolineae bacterium]MBT6059917.1 DNA mismatch repair endonuclease MutL [Anaerolineae bacterium]
MPIKILSPELASQIAAGEVVERPASVVKELVENSLDAGATSVSVIIEEAGRRVIEVADDGYGIPADEVVLAVERHATSKLHSADELFSIGTLGFRGEALASIGSVARFTLTSRTEDDEAATRMIVEGGISTPPQQVGAPSGTVVRVENLFYNVPARLKFLKADTTERRRIDALLTRYALAYPGVRFKLVQNGQAKLQTSGNGDRRAILATLYGVDVAKDFLEVNAAEDDIRLTGFISPTSLTRSNRREITFFINGRWVQDISLSTATIKAYHTLLMVGRYPLAALFLDLEPASVDVNVHPTKAEVRFRDPSQMFSFVQRSVRKAILAYTPVPQMGIAPPALWTEKPARQSSGVDAAWQFAQETDGGRSTVNGQDTPETLNSIPTIPLLRLVGQIGSVYIIAEGPDGLYLIDQHAAHERVLFERLLAQREANTISSQKLLEPEVVHLPPAQATLLEGQLAILQKFGFEVEAFGPNAFQVRAIPTLFTGANPAAALRVLVEDFEGDETPLQEKLEDKIAARVCKRMAVKGGQTLSTAEQESLLRDLENCESPRTCPHGRPTMIHLSVDMLEKQFGRTGPR